MGAKLHWGAASIPNSLYLLACGTINYCVTATKPYFIITLHNSSSGKQDQCPWSALSLVRVRKHQPVLWLCLVDTDTISTASLPPHPCSTSHLKPAALSTTDALSSAFATAFVALQCSCSYSGCHPVCWGLLLLTPACHQLLTLCGPSVPVSQLATSHPVACSLR